MELDPAAVVPVHPRGRTGPRRLLLGLLGEVEWVERLEDRGERSGAS